MPSFCLPVETGLPSGAAGVVARFRLAWGALECPPDWRRLLVAVSGGPDSLALLHLLHETRDRHRLDLVVGHVDHGIHPESHDVARQVVRVAEGLGLSCVVGRLHLGTGTSETTARDARHRWLEDTRRHEGADALVLAHHRDDQVETILLRVLGGSGPAGLAGMAPRQGRRLRPLLTFRKSELVEWLASKGITGWLDPANADQSHSRSWVRQTLVPMLTGREPEVASQILRLGRQAAANRRAWETALDAIPGLDVQESRSRISVAALPLATYDSALAGALLQASARRIGCVLGPRRVERLLRMVRRGRSGAAIELGGAWRAELAFGRICFYRNAPAPAPLRLVGARGSAPWGAWRVSWSRGVMPDPVRRDGWVGWFIGEEAVLRAPATGDRLVPFGGRGRRAVSRLLQEARIERSRRGAWPVLEVDDQIVWVGGICRGQGAIPAPGSEALRIEVTGD